MHGILGIQFGVYNALLILSQDLHMSRIDLIRPVAAYKTVFLA